MNRSRTGLIGTTALTLALLLGCSARRPAVTAPESGAVVLLEDLDGLQIFPASDAWNLDASQAPVDPSSQAYIDWISGRTAQNPTAVTTLGAYFGPPPWGIPYVVVSGTQPLLPVAFVTYPGESDAGAPGRPTGYPILCLATGI